MIAPRKRWGPRETPRFIRNQETRRFYVGRWYPEKQPVGKIFTIKPVYSNTEEWQSG